jgi:hypothetical protein
MNHVTALYLPLRLPDLMHLATVLQLISSITEFGRSTAGKGDLQFPVLIRLRNSI